MSTDWERQLARRAQAVQRAKHALDEGVAAARLDGHSFREIGRWAGVNHERARGIAKAVNGHTRTRGEFEETRAAAREHIRQAYDLPAEMTDVWDALDRARIEAEAGCPGGEPA